MKDNFEDQGSIQQTTDMAAEMSAFSNDTNSRCQTLKHALLTGLAIATIGAYSNFHENSIYANDYSTPDTIQNKHASSPHRTADCASALDYTLVRMRLWVLSHNAQTSSVDPPELILVRPDSSLQYGVFHEYVSNPTSLLRL